MNKIIVLGLGPGAEEYILPVVFQKISECSVLIGGKRNLEIFQEEKCSKISIEGKYTKLEEIIRKELENGNVGLAVSGDPGFYSLLNIVKIYFPDEVIEVIPGISSLQYLFSKGIMNWQDALLVSLHGKQTDFIEAVKENRKIGFLTDEQNSPCFIAKTMLKEGISDKKILVGERLSYKDEKISFLTVEETAEGEFDKLSVMVVYE